MITCVIPITQPTTRFAILAIACLFIASCSVGPTKKTTYYDPNPPGILLGSSQSVDITGIFGNDGLEDASTIDSLNARLIAIGLLITVGESEAANDLVDQSKAEDAPLLMAMIKRQSARSNNNDVSSGNPLPSAKTDVPDILKLFESIDADKHWGKKNEFKEKGDLPPDLASQVTGIESASLSVKLSEDPRALVGRAMISFDRAFENADNSVAEPSNSLTGIALSAGYLSVGRNLVRKSQAPADRTDSGSENVSDLVNDLYIDNITALEKAANSPDSSVDSSDIDIDGLAELSEILYENTGIDTTPQSPNTKSSKAMRKISDMVETAANGDRVIATRDLILMREQFEVAASDIANVEVTVYQNLLITLYSSMSTGNKPGEPSTVQGGAETLSKLSETASEAERLIDEEIRLMRE